MVVKRGRRTGERSALSGTSVETGGGAGKTADSREGKVLNMQLRCDWLHEQRGGEGLMKEVLFIDQMIGAGEGGETLTERERRPVNG